MIDKRVPWYVVHQMVEAAMAGKEDACPRCGRPKPRWEPMCLTCMTRYGHEPRGCPSPRAEAAEAAEGYRSASKRSPAHARESGYGCAE